MNLNEFIKIIKESGKISGGISKIVIDLCKYSDMKLSESTIESWFKKGKSGRTPRYDQIIDRRGFIKYFKEKTSITWKDIQKKFKELNQYECIDCTTENSEIFYNSLLKQFYYILQSAPVSLKYIPPINPLLIGREQELKEIENVFKESNFVILNGIGGIGKSSIASAYSHLLNENQIWTVQQVICENTDTIQDAILKLKFDKLEESEKDTLEYRCKDRIKFLENNLKPVLIILDNLNYCPKSNELDILKMDYEYLQHIRFLITSRNKWNFAERNTIQIEPLKNDDLFTLYATHRFKDPDLHKKYIEKNKDTLNKLFSLVKNHTLIITLLAKLSIQSCLTEKELLERLSLGLKLPTNTIVFSKDKNDYENSIEDILRILFDISHLNDSQKSIMTYMSLIPTEGIEIKTFCELVHVSTNDIQKLINSNWIIKDEETFRIHLHTLICETILSNKDIRPSKETYTSFADTIEKIRDEFERYTTEWLIYNKILIHIPTKVIFAEIRDFRFPNTLDVSIFDMLKPEYVNAILTLNKFSEELLNMDISIPRNYVALEEKTEISDNNIDDNINDDNDDDDTNAGE